jgi:hypothetical protein
MKRGKLRVLYLLLFVFTLLLAACSGTGAEQEASVELENVSSESTTFDLPEAYDFGRFGFRIAYPAGWVASTQEPVTIISELQSDHDVAFNDDQSNIEGYQVSLDHRGMAFMRSIGFNGEQELEALFELNKTFFDWQESIEGQETEAFGVPALAVKTTDGDIWEHTLMGFVNDEAFLLSMSAPTEEALDKIMPTWEAMLAGIELSDG